MVLDCQAGRFGRSGVGIVNGHSFCFLCFHSTKLEVILGV